MAANTLDLWNQHAEKWKTLYDLYSKVIKVKAEKKTKPQARKDLLSLDKWYQNELPVTLQSRSKAYLTHDEIQKLMKWKLARGKFRPALPGLVASNKPDDVEKTTRSALSLLPDVEAAIRGLSTLRGIGPATASAILAAAAPDVAPFMADECVLATPGISVIKYDLNCYLIYCKALQQVTKRLKKEDPDGDWSVHKAELTIWTHAIASSMAPELLPATSPDRNQKPAGDAESDTKENGRKRRSTTKDSDTKGSKRKK